MSDEDVPGYTGDPDKIEVVKTSAGVLMHIVKDDLDSGKQLISLAARDLDPSDDPFKWAMDVIWNALDMSGMFIRTLAESSGLDPLPSLRQILARLNIDLDELE